MSVNFGALPKELNLASAKLTKIATLVHFQCDTTSNMFYKPHLSFIDKIGMGRNFKNFSTILTFDDLWPILKVTRWSYLCYESKYQQFSVPFFQNNKQIQTFWHRIFFFYLCVQFIWNEKIIGDAHGFEIITNWKCPDFPI